MSVIHVTEATVGAPNSGRMSGTNGDLYAMLKYALPLNGWAVEYDDSTNFAAVFRPGSGNRFRLHINDNSATSGDARLAVIRGCENASAAATLVDPFPQVANIANSASNWLKSTLANTTARNFDIFVGETWVFYAVNAGGSANSWEYNFFGDVSPSQPGDAYNTVCFVRNTSATSVASTSFQSSSSGTVPFRWCRSYDGTVKDTTGGVFFAGPTIGAISTFPIMLAGATGGVDRIRAQLLCSGQQTTGFSTAKGMPIRGWFPNLWVPNHADSKSVVSTRDVFDDTSYNASAQFTVFQNTGCLIVENTDTWVPPSG